MYEDEDELYELESEDSDEFEDEEESVEDESYDDDPFSFDDDNSDDESVELETEDIAREWFRDTRPTTSFGGGRGGGGGGSLASPPLRGTTGKREPSSWEAVDMEKIVGSLVNDTDNPMHQPTLLYRDDGHGLFYHRAVNSIYGEPETGKSLIAQLAVVEELESREFPGYQSHVVYIDYESDARTVARRLISLGADPSDLVSPWIFMYIHPTESPFDENARRDWLDNVLNYSDRTRLVIIDGVTEAFSTTGTSSVDNDGVARWMRAVPKRIADETGSAVVIVDHVTKSNDTTKSRFAIGAQAKLSAITGVSYKIKPVRQPIRGGRGSVRLLVTKDRPGSVREFSDRENPYADGSMATAVITFDSTENPDVIKSEVLAWNSETATNGPVADDIANDRPVELMERLSKTLSEHPEGMTKSAAVNATTGGKAKKFVALACLVDDGNVEERDGRFFLVTEFPVSESPG